MENAEDTVKEVADTVTFTNSEDGNRHALKEDYQV